MKMNFYSKQSPIYFLLLFILQVTNSAFAESAISDSTHIYIGVQNMNVAPVAGNDVVTINEDGTANGSVAGNDSDADNLASELSYTQISPVTQGIFNLNSAGTYSFSPSANYNGAVVVSYKVCDPLGACDTATLTINVTSINDEPTANNDVRFSDEDTFVSGSVASNDFDVDNTQSDLVYTKIGITTEWQITLTSNGAYTFLPPANFSGIVAITYKVCDPTNLCDTASLIIIVNPVNDPPVAQDGSATIKEDSTISGNIRAFASDVDNSINELVFSYVDMSVSGGNFTITPTGTYTFTPPLNFTGTMTVRYKVCDPLGACDTATLTFTVTPINDAPVAVDDATNIDENKTLNGTVAANDSDVDDPSTDLTYMQIGSTTEGVFTMNPNGTYTFVPRNNFNGTVNITYKVCDKSGLCDTATLTIVVNPVNDPPNIVVTPVTVEEDYEDTFCFAITDADIGDTHNASICGTTNGAATVDVVNGEVCMTYTPNANFSGQDSVCIRVCDAGGLCTNVTVPITVTPINDSPEITVSPITTEEDTQITTCYPITDPDIGDKHTASICGVQNGTATVNIVNGEACVTYTPNANYVGVDEICINVQDSSGSFFETIIPVTVTPKNDAPSVIITTVTVEEDGTTIKCFPIIDTDTGDTHTASICENPKNGTATINIINGEACLSYTPTANFNGLDSVCIKICDAAGECVQKTVQITVTPKNDAPSVSVTPITVEEDNSKTTCFPITDIDAGDTHNASICENPKNGTASINIVNGEACLTYTPNRDFIGIDSVCIRVCDAAGACIEKVVQITVTPKNDAPTVTVSTIIVDEDGSKTTCFTITDADAGDTHTASICENPKNGTASINIVNGEACLSYTPTANFNGLDSVCIKICDAAGECVQKMVQITVIPKNDAPTITVTPITVEEDNSKTTCFPITDIDAGDTHNASICENPKNGTASINIVNGEACLAYTPNANFIGKDSVCIKICDAAGECVQKTVQITVTPKNDAPSVSVTPITVEEDDSKTACFPITDIDAGDTHNASICENPKNGTASINIVNGEACLTYTPNPNFNGNDSVCIKICDAAGECVQKTVQITVTPKNDNPSVSVTPITVEEDDSKTTCFPITDADTGDTHNASICENPKNGIASINIVNGEACLTYTPNANFIGKDSVCIKICDAAGACIEKTVQITVTPKNDNPSVSVTPITVEEDDSKTTCFPITDIDAGDTHTASICENPKNGTASINIVNGEACLSYTPNPNFNGLDSVCIRICDVAGACIEKVVQITVTPINDSPEITVSPITTDEDTEITTCYPIVDADAGDTHTASICGVLNGKATVTIINGEACVTYKPNNNYSGSDEICIRIQDAAGAFIETIIPVTVIPKNDAPTVVVTPITLDEDTSLSACFPISDADAGDTHTASICTNAVNGVASVVIDNGKVCLTYTPKPNFNGKDSVCIKVCDAAGQCVEKTVQITVIPKNDNPVVTVKPLTVNSEYTTSECFDILDVDVNDTHTATICSLTQGEATAEVKNNKLCVTYTAPNTEGGTETICITICDNAGGCTIVNIPVTITVCIDNSDPKITCPAPIEVNLVGNILSDPDKFIQTSSIADNCSGVVLSFKTPTGTHICGNVISTQINGLTSGSIFPVGAHTVVFEARNRTNQTATCSTSIVVKPITLVSLKNPSFCPNTQISLASQSYVGGKYEWKKNNQVVSQTNELFNRLATVDESGQYILNATFGNCILKDTVNITVFSTPEANNDAYYTASDEIIAKNVITNDTILRGSNVVIRLAANNPPLTGNLAFKNDGSFEYTPKSGYSGTEKFKYEVCDANCPTTCSQATVNIDVISQYRGTNVITPNGDGDNDTFVIDGYDPTSPNSELTEIIFYNQWGDIVHRTKGYKNDWKGDYKSEPLPAGTYYYYFKKTPNSTPIKGFVTILR